MAKVSVSASTETQQAILLYGFVFCARQDTNASIAPAYHTTTAPISLSQATTWLAQEAKTEKEFIWLHFNLSNQGTLRWMQEHLPLPSSFYESLAEEGSSTRIEQTEDHLLALINDVRYEGLEIDASEIATLWASVDHNTLITLRRKPLRSIDHLRRSVQRQGHEFRSPTDLLAQLFRHQADVLLHIMRENTARVDRIEDTILAGRLKASRNQLGTQRRTLVRLQRLLAPEPSALFRLINRPPAWIAEEDINELSQTTEEFSTAMRDMAGLQERIKLLQEEITSLIMEQTNRSLFVLTGITVIALPINLFAGLFGMNVGGIPFAEDGHGFWMVLLFVLSISGLVAWLGVKRIRYLG
jgi:zinc transporter